MQRGQLVVDGLWRCLCPAFDRACFSRAAVRQTRRRRPAPTTTTPSAANQSYRALVTEAVAPAIAPRKQWSPIPPPPRTRPHDADPSTAAATGFDEPAVEGTWDQRLLLSAHPNEATLRASSLADITRALSALRDPQKWRPEGQTIDQHQRILLLISHLISAREQPPGLFLYECLADAMADPQGSAKGLRRLLDDMAQQGMRPTAAFCASALDALVNHPDYVMREEMLDIMRQHWFTIDGPVRQKYVLGLLRDEQYELAYSRLGDMIENGARIDGWVYDIFILTFGKLGYLDEMLSLLHRRSAQSGLGSMGGCGGGSGGSSAETVSNLQYYALDVFSRASHHAGTLFAWNAVVRSSRAQPSDGILEGVLATAARQGDAQLATEAFERLSGRGRVQPHHYDAVVDAFCACGDVAAALRTLCIMRNAGLSVTRSRTRSLHRALMGRGGGGVELVRAAEAAARELARETAVPQEVIGAILEVVAAREGSARAMQLYGDVPLLCGGQPPTASMMQDVILHLHAGSSSSSPSSLSSPSSSLGETSVEETRRALLREYAARFPDASGADDPKRSGMSYGALARACAEVGEMDLAFRFAGRALGSTDPQARKGQAFFDWVRTLVERAMEREDGRIWPVVDELQRSSAGGVGKLVRRLLQQQRMARLAAEWKAKRGR